MYTFKTTAIYNLDEREIALIGSILTKEYNDYNEAYQTETNEEDRVEFLKKADDFRTLAHRFGQITESLKDGDKVRIDCTKL